MMDNRDFGGVIGRYRNESTPWWPEPVRPPEGAPNVLVVLLDDVGFAQLGCFGSDIGTPVIDSLAANGLRYANFHTTALCSPTRACVLTGRNHHSTGMGRLVELPTGFPGYTSRIPKSCGFLSEMLVPHGYAAYAVGKWHLTPDNEWHVGATRERWPLGKGFERYYGFFGGETNQFAPALYHDNHRVEAPRSWQDGYHLTEDLMERAVEYVQDLKAGQPDKPFFLYLCPGACHSPHQAPRDWIDRYAGRFDQGWDVWREQTLARQIASGLLPEGAELSPRPDWVPAWDSLSDDQHRLYARYQECFAAYLSHADHHLGRVIDALRDMDELDNTLIFVLSDNGASSEGGVSGSINDIRPWNITGTTEEEALRRIDEIGGPFVHNNYPWGWTMAGNTPFKRWKRETHEGGVADPLVVHWPAGMRARGEVRHQYVHAIDLVSTALDAIGVAAPHEIDGVEQQPVEGTSFTATFDDAAAPATRTTQYFEMFGCRAIYHDGWKAVTHHPIFAQHPGFDEDRWELYHVAEDVAECRDLAEAEPDRLREMIDLWWDEAKKYNVLPLDNSPFDAIFGDGHPGVTPRQRYVYYPGGAPVPETTAVSVRNRSHTIAAEVDIPNGGAEGVLLAQGSPFGGYTLFVRDGKLHYVHNFVALQESRVSSTVNVTPGRHTLALRFEKTAEHAGTGTLLIDGTNAGSVEIARFTPTRFTITGDGLTCGYEAGLPPCRDYEPPFRFTGTLKRVVVEVEGAPFADPKADADLAIKSQ